MNTITAKQFRPTVLLYHFPKNSPCADGFAAAVAAHLYGLRGNPGIRLIPFDHTDHVSSGVHGERVVMIDCCFERSKLLELKKYAEAALVLDHHQSAMQDCGDLPFCHFDLLKSGARLAWEFFFPTEPLPALFFHVEDRDLHRYSDPKTRFYCASLDGTPRTFDSWLALLSQTPAEQANFLHLGEVRLEQMRQQIQELGSRAFPIQLFGHTAMACNAPSPFNSGVANYLANTHPEVDFAVTFAVESGQARISFRSRREGMDVTTIAKILGGGGHPHASGAVVSFETMAQLLQGHLR